MSIHDFERYPLTFGPSPIHHLPRLTSIWAGPRSGRSARTVNSGLAFGGNKTRKLEYIVPDILAEGADTIVSIGGFQSNHTRQVAAVAAKLGLKARLVQENWVDWPDPLNDRVGNILLSRLMGADVRLDASGLRHRHPRVLEGRASPKSRPPAASPTPSPPARPSTSSAGSGFATGPTKWPAGGGTRGLLRHHRGLHGHRIHPRRHDRRIRRTRGRGRPSPPRDRHRRLRHPGQDPRPGRPDRPGHRQADRPRARPARGRDQPSSKAGPATSTAFPSTPPLKPCGWAPRWKRMITDPVYEGKSLAGLIDLVRQARRSPPTATSSMPTSAGSRPSTPTPAFSGELGVRRNARPGRNGDRRI